MNSNRSVLLAILHYIGLLFMALFVFVGISFLFGNMITGIAATIFVVAVVEIFTVNIRKRRRQSFQNYNSSSMLTILWSLYLILFFLTAPIILHGFSVGVVERGDIEQKCSADVNSLDSLYKIVSTKFKNRKAALDKQAQIRGDYKAGVEIENKLAPVRKAMSKIKRLQDKAGENLKNTTLNPFNFLFFFERDLREYKTEKLKLLEELTQLNLIESAENNPLDIDVSRFSVTRIEWGASIIFLILIHLLILWEIYNTSVAKRGKIPGGNSGPGIHAYTSRSDKK